MGCVRAAVDIRMTETGHAVEMSFEARLAEQHKFSEHAASIRALGETVEHQASGLANLSGSSPRRW